MPQIFSDRHSLTHSETRSAQQDDMTAPKLNPEDLHMTQLSLTPPPTLGAHFSSSDNVSPSVSSVSDKNYAATIKSPTSQSAEEDDDDLAASKQSLLELKHFLRTAPLEFSQGDIIHQFWLPNEEQVSCVHWGNSFCITGTDIVRSLIRRFSIFGRDVINRKKFEEGVFSDLRNLKINVDATLEGSKSELLEFLFKRNCVRTKKKQKVFKWTSVRHDRLFIDVLSRELKKEAAARSSFSDPTFLNEEAQTKPMASTVAKREPALSFQYDKGSPLADQIPQIIAKMKPKYRDLFRELTTSAPPPEDVATILDSRNAPEISHEPQDPRSTRYKYMSPHPYSMLQSGSPGRYPITPQLSSQKANSRWGREDSWNQLLSTPQSLRQRSYDPYHYQPVAGPPHVEPPVNQSQQVPTLQLPSHPLPLPSQPPPPALASQLQPPAAQQMFSSPKSFADRYDTDMDFSLEFLVREDQQPVDPVPAFEAEYSDFAYQNRPALRDTTCSIPHFEEAPYASYTSVAPHRRHPSLSKYELGQYEAVYDDSPPYQSSPSTNSAHNPEQLLPFPQSPGPYVHGNLNGVSKKTNRRSPHSRTRYPLDESDSLKTMEFMDYQY